MTGMYKCIVDGCSVEAMLQRMVLVAKREKSGRF